MDFYLGLTGLPGTGKEAVARLITAALATHGIQTLHYSLSGPIALELHRRGLPPDREQLRSMANTVRANLGNGAWAARTAREAHETLTLTDWTDVLVMIDGVRNPAEITTFRELWGSRFHLLAVSAPEDVRRLNLAVRSSPKDAAVLEHLATAASDSAAIAPVLTAEMGIGQPQHGTNVLACIELADWTLENTEHDASMHSLRRQVQEVVERLVLPLYGQGGVQPPDALLPLSVRQEAVGEGRGGVRALVVDSDRAWQAQLALLLEQEGCTVEVAGTYAEASRRLLDQPLREPYRLLTVDLHDAAEGDSDSGTGFDLLESLHYFDRSLPSIVVSAHVTAEQVRRALRDFGAHDCFGKQNFSAQAFRARVRQMMQEPVYVVAALETGASGHLLVGQPSILSLRLQREAPPQEPASGEAPEEAAARSKTVGLARPSTATEWTVELALKTSGVELDVQPSGPQPWVVSAASPAVPLVFTLTPRSAGDGRLEIEFHQPGQFVDRLAFDLPVRTPS